MTQYMNIQIKGEEKISLGLQHVSRETIEAIHTAMVMGGNRIRNKMIQGMKRTPKLGRVYYRGRKRGKRGKMIGGTSHRASVSPNYPAIDTGGLVGSLHLDERRLHIEVGSSIARLRRGKNKYGGAQYPLFLEEGTKRMGKRPWLEPSYKSSRGAIRRSIERAVNRAITQAGGAAT